MLWIYAGGDFDCCHDIWHHYDDALFGFPIFCDFQSNDSQPYCPDG